MKVLGKKCFWITIVSGIIHEFEYDRTKILNQIFIELQKEKKKKEEKEINRRAEELAKKIVADTKKVDEELFGKSKRIDLFRQKKEDEIADSFKETFKKRSLLSSMWKIRSLPRI